MKFCATALLSFSIVLAAASVAVAEPADDLFLAAKDAARAGDRAKLERLSGELSGYELEPYVVYWR